MAEAAALAFLGESGGDSKNKKKKKKGKKGKKVNAGSSGGQDNADAPPAPQASGDTKPAPSTELTAEQKAAAAAADNSERRLTGSLTATGLRQAGHARTHYPSCPDVQAMMCYAEAKGPPQTRMGISTNRLASSPGARIRLGAPGSASSICMVSLVTCSAISSR